MSASSKKKLRNEQAAEKMTQRQQHEQKEAKKLRTYTIIFSVVVVLMLVFALATVAYRGIANSGILARNTTAVTVGEHKLSSAEMNYFFVDTVYNYYNTNSSYISYILNTSTPLDQQAYFGNTEGYTWADYFMDSAKNQATAVYALTDAAKAAGHTLSEDEIAAIDNSMEVLELYATYNNYSDPEDYLQAMYGNGATLKSYRAYTELNKLATSYQTAHQESLSYDDAALRAAEAENYAQYSAFSYNMYYVEASKFLIGGTTAEDGTTTYTDEEKARAVSLAKEAADSLISDEIQSVEDLDAAIGALYINAEAETPVTSTAYTDYAYSKISTTYQEWITDDARVEGNKTVIPYVTGEEGSEVTNGYYVLYFVGANDNNYPLVNVRHILIAPEGGTYDSSTGSTTYSDEEWAAAKEKAEQMLKAWEDANGDEDSFKALANENSADSDGSDGGLYTDVYPGQMVTNFNDWCFAEGRKKGDTGIVESDYGYHIMFYSGDSETLYRDFLIENDLLTADMNAWYDGIVSAVTAEIVDTKYIRTGMTMTSY